MIICYNLSMKKTIIIAIFIREKSALTEFFLKLSEQLIELDYHVIILTNEQRNDLINENSSPQIRTWPSYYPTKPKDFIFIRKLIQKHNPEMIISNFSATNFCLLAGRLAKVPHRIPWVHTISTAMTEVAPWKFWRKKYLYKLATSFIANSEATRQDSIDKYDINPKHIITIPNLIHNNDKYIIENIPKEDIVFVGRFYETKGIDTLIKAMSLVIDVVPSLKLKIIAGGDDTEYRKIVEEYNLADNIIFMGRLERKDVMQNLATSICSIVPSKAEAFGYVVIEALSVKTPVIGSDTGGISEIINDNVNGMLFPVNNSQVLAEKIITMVLQKELRNHYAQKGYETFKNNYDLDNNINKATTLIHDLLTSKHD